MMSNEVLLSIALVGQQSAARQEIEAALDAALAQLNLVVTATTYPGATFMTAVKQAAELPPELPLPASDEPLPAEVVLPVEQAIAEPEQQTVAPPAATDVEVAPSAPKFEAVCRILDLSTTDEFCVMAGEQQTLLVAENVDSSVPGLISFTVGGTSYKFPVSEQNKIAATIVIGSKNKRVALDVVESKDELQTGTIVLGAGDAELLTVEE